MTALERALVVYAEAKGYEVERQSRGQIEKWELLEQPIGFNFAFNRYRLRDPRNMHKVCNSLYAEYLPNIPEKSISEMVENIKKFKPAGFSCKTKILTREEIEEMNKPKEEEFDVKAYVKSLVETPEYLKREKEVDPIIEILESYKNGETIEIWDQYQERWYKVEKPMWDFVENRYRVAPKQPEAIPATEEELNKAIRDSWGWIMKNKETGEIKVRKFAPVNKEEWWKLNVENRTWIDWSSK